MARRLIRWPHRQLALWLVLAAVPLRKRDTLEGVVIPLEGLRLTALPPG